MRFAWVAGVLVLMLVSPAWAGGELWAPWSDDKASTEFVALWSDSRRRVSDACSAEKRLAEMLKTGKSLAEASSLLAKEFGLSPEDAGELAELLVARRVQALPLVRKPPRSKELVDKVCDHYVDLLKSSHHNQAVMDAILSLHPGWVCPKRDLLRDFVLGAPNALAFGFELSSKDRSGSLLARLNAIDPGNRAIAWKLADRYSRARPSRKLALLESLSKRHHLGDKSDPLFEFSVAVQREYLYALLEGGFLEDAVRVHDGLPAEQQTALSGQNTRNPNATVDGLPVSLGATREHALFFQKQFILLDLELTGAQVLLGRRKEARALRSKLQWVESASVYLDQNKRYLASMLGHQLSKVRLIDRVLEGQSKDPYAWLRAVLGIQRNNSMFRSFVWVSLAMKVLSGRRYDPSRRRIANFWQKVVVEREESEEDSTIYESFGPAFASRSRHFREGLLKRGEDLASLAGKDSPKEQVKSTASTFFKPSELHRFEYRAVPKGEKYEFPADRSYFRDGLALPDGVAALPVGHKLLRFSKEGPWILALSTPKPKDMLSEKGVLWVHLSKDKGRSWSQSWPVPLKEVPKIYPETKGRLLVGDAVTPVMHGRSYLLDQGGVKPAEGNRRWTLEDMYLLLPLDLLRADKDGDGLTDLYERFLCLDPESADSDGDGLDDGKDPNPNVAFDLGGTEGEWVRVFLESILKQVNGDIKVMSVGRKAARDEALAAVLSFGFEKDQPAIIVEGDPSLFASVAVNRRLIVWTADQVKELRELRGEKVNVTSVSTWPIRMGGAVFNESGTRGFISWSWGCCLGARGGVIEVTRTRDGWKAETISSWIS